MFKRSVAAGNELVLRYLFKHRRQQAMSLPLRYLFKHLNMAAWMFGNFPHRRG